MNTSQLKRSISGFSQFLKRTSFQKVQSSDDDSHEQQRLFCESAYIMCEGEKHTISQKGLSRIRLPKGSEYQVFIVIFTSDDSLGHLYFEENIEYMAKRKSSVLKLEEKLKIGNMKVISFPKHNTDKSLLTNVKVEIRVRESRIKDDLLKIEFVYD